MQLPTEYNFSKTIEFHLEQELELELEYESEN